MLPPPPPFERQAPRVNTDAGAEAESMQRSEAKDRTIAYGYETEYDDALVIVYIGT